MEEEVTYSTGQAKYKRGDILIARIKVKEVVESKERGIEYVVCDVGDTEDIYIGRIPERDVKGCQVPELVPVDILGRDPWANREAAIAIIVHQRNVAAKILIFQDELDHNNTEEATQRLWLAKIKNCIESMERKEKEVVSKEKGGENG